MLMINIGGFVEFDGVFLQNFIRQHADNNDRCIRKICIEWIYCRCIEN